VSTYATVSIVFWYVGMIPDLATMRDRAKSLLARKLYGIFSLGWRGSAAHWQRYEMTTLLLSGLSTPLVLSVHTVVSFDFAVSLIPGWHATIFPPYFVAGAIYAGFAMVLTLMLPLRAIYGLHDFITDRHVDNMAKVTLATGLIVFYGYCMEAFFGWYSANQFEQYMIYNRMTGPYALQYWLLILCNGVIPQLLWFRRVRRSVPILFAICMAVNVGMWLERFIIVITSLHRDYLPGSWGMYSGTFWDWSTFIGTMGLFLTLFYLFIRVLPIIAVFELRTLTPAAHARGEDRAGQPVVAKESNQHG
jgi:Ni/Fe-hydrogenase subunit HybB-like protein